MRRTEGADVGRPKQPGTSDEKPTVGDGGPVERPLLERAGVIGADMIGPDDAGNAFIPQRDAPSGPAPTVGNRSAAQEGDWTKIEATPATREALRRLGVDPAAVAAAPVSPDELVGWLWHGFAIEEIGDWLGHGSVRAAVRRRDAGLPP